MVGLGRGAGYSGYLRPDMLESTSTVFLPLCVVSLGPSLGYKIRSAGRHDLTFLFSAMKSSFRRDTQAVASAQSLFEPINNP
jgi:hypothetical protein